MAFLQGRYENKGVIDNHWNQKEFNLCDVDPRGVDHLEPKGPSELNVEAAPAIGILAPPDMDPTSPQFHPARLLSSQSRMANASAATSGGSGTPTSSQRSFSPVVTPVSPAFKVDTF